jgi:hypothetical protein
LESSERTTLLNWCIRPGTKITPSPFLFVEKETKQKKHYPFPNTHNHKQESTEIMVIPGIFKPIVESSAAPGTRYVSSTYKKTKGRQAIDHDSKQTSNAIMSWIPENAHSLDLFFKDIGTHNDEQR